MDVLPGLPRAIEPTRYRSQSFLDRELERVFPQSWLVVARESDVADPGRYVCFDVVGLSLFVLRDDHGQVGVFHNRCRHRATRLLDGSGRLDRVVCPYHGWQYARDGGLAHVPRREGFPRGALTGDLERARAEPWGGFVWVNPDGAAPPLREYLGSVAPAVERYRPGEMVTLEERCWEIPCNWKAILDNTNELYHLPLVHRRTVGGLEVSSTLMRLGPHYEVEMNVPVSPLRRLADRATLPAGLGLAPDEHARFRKYLIFPNTLVNVLPHHLTVYRPFPLSPGRCRLYYGFYRPRRAGVLGRLRARASWALSRMVLREDLRAVEMFQRGVDSGGGGPMWLHSDLESALAHFHDALDERLGADGDRGGLCRVR